MPKILIAAPRIPNLSNAPIILSKASNTESARLEAQAPGLQAEILAQKKAFIAAGGSAEDFGRQLGDKTRQKALLVAESLVDLQTETNLLREQQAKALRSIPPAITVS